MTRFYIWFDKMLLVVGLVGYHLPYTDSFNESGREIKKIRSEITHFFSLNFYFNSLEHDFGHEQLKELFFIRLDY